MILQKAAGVAGRLTHRILHNKKQLEILRLQGGPGACQAIAGAIGSMGAPASEKLEKEWSAKIEALREELNHSSQFVPEFIGSEPENLVMPATAEGKGHPVGTICRMASKNPQWALALYRLVRDLDAKNCLELGTCLGISGAYQAAALKVKGSGGRLITLEGNPYRAKIARDNFAKLGLDNVEVGVGFFTDTLKPALQELGSVDYAFIDGHHDGDATVAYYREILPYLNDRSVVIFDDITWSPSMKRAWAEITADKRVLVAVDLFKVGLTVVGKEPGPRLNARIAVD